MRHALSCGIAALFFAVTNAGAADIAVKTPPDGGAPLPVYSWTGLYLGAHVGGIGGEFKSNVPLGIPGPLDNAGSVMGGAQIGYNWQAGSWVFGIEADTSAINVEARTTPLAFDETWLTTVRGRVGHAWDRYLVYFTAGAGFTHVEATAATGSVERTVTGVALGGGLEAALWQPNWTVRGEYLYVDVPLESYLIGPTRIDGGSHNHVGRIAVNYRFW